MKFEQLKEGLFVKYISEMLFATQYVYGRVMFVDDEKVRILTYDDFDVLEFRKHEIEQSKMVEVYETELMQYLVMRKEVLTELLEEIRVDYAKQVVNINVDISKIDTCINDLKS